MPKVQAVTTYLVGGAVRDKLLGRPVLDRDWLVVGANMSYMVERGFLPVGRDFPVFLHPTTHEEYALARTERKVSRGYAGFEFYANENVTLNEDLARRDLTINAIAEDENGRIIDPFGGQDDLKNGVLRHIGPHFVEDPVRILRVARFAARYGFKVAPETLALMKEMVQNQEVAYLVAERTWQEIAKGLMEPQPHLLIKTLQACSALSVILPEVAALLGVPQSIQHHPEVDALKHTLLALQETARQNLGLPARWAVLLHDVGKALTPKHFLPKHPEHDAVGVPLVRAVNQRLKVPKNVARIAELSCRYHILFHRVFELEAHKIVHILQESDAFRRFNHVQVALDVAHADFCGREGFQETPYPQKAFWYELFEVARAIDIKSITNPCRKTIFNARLARVQAFLAARKGLIK